MNILVTGANGQLGNHMRRLASQHPHRWFFTDVEELDIADKDVVEAFVSENDIEAVVNCAAYTNVDKAEDDEATADRINHVAVSHLAQAMKRVGGLLIHISTDYVFGGNEYNIPYAEQTPANPTGAYGRTKLAGEEAVLAIGCDHIIIRTAWLYSEYGMNFLKTMHSLMEAKPQLNVVFDQVGTPTYAGDLANAICQILASDSCRKHQGIYHFSNEGVCSWYDFAKEIARQTGCRSCDIQPCHSDEFPSKVSRPHYSVLDKTKIKATFGTVVPYWTDSLSTCINNMKTK